jgi:hypothetical protein
MASEQIGPPPYYHRSDCNICRKQDDLKTGSELLDAPRPGGYIIEGEHFLAEHAPLQESSAGTVILEARRHLLDFGEMAPPTTHAGPRACSGETTQARPADPTPSSRGEITHSS